MTSTWPLTGARPSTSTTTLPASTSCLRRGGGGALALQYADKLCWVVPEPVIEQFASYIDGMNALRMHIYIRFGMWDEILEHPEYPGFVRPTGRSAGTRAMALAN